MLTKIRAKILRWTLPRCQVCRQVIAQRRADVCARPECADKWASWQALGM